MGCRRLNYLRVEHLCAVSDVSARRQDKESPEKPLTACAFSSLGCEEQWAGIWAQTTNQHKVPMGTAIRGLLGTGDTTPAAAKRKTLPPAETHNL